MRLTPHSLRRSSMKSETVFGIRWFLLLRTWIGDCRKQRVLGLPGVQPGVLDDDRGVGADHAGVAGVTGYRLRIGELVEAQVKGPARRDHQRVGAGGVA